jgi:hypothetical protein
MSESSQPTIHNFTESNNEYQDIDNNWVKDRIMSVFPGSYYVTDEVKHIEAQKRGHDREVHLPHGKVSLLDAKIRRTNYDDILIEFRHSDGQLGWIEENLTCDWILWIFPNHKTVRLPFYDLQQAWFKNRDKWLKRAESSKKEDSGYAIRKAENTNYRGDRYTTFNLSLPEADLFQAVGGMFRSPAIEVTAPPTPEEITSA